VSSQVVARARWRLVAFVAVSLLALELGCGLALIAQIRSEQRAALDTRIERTAASANSILGEDPNHAGQIDLSQFTETPHIEGDPSVAVLNANGSQVAGEDFSGRAATRLALELSNRDIETAVSTEVAGESVRMAALPILGNHGNTIGVDAAFLPTASTSSAIRTAEVLIVAGAAVVWLLIVTIAWLLSGQAAAPALASVAREEVFLADAAHELRTPIAIIRARAEHALSIPGVDPVAADLRAVTSAADDAARTLTAMLELARLDSDRPVIRREPLRLDALVETAVSNLAQQASAAAVSLTVDAGVNVVIDGDEHLLTLAVTNLIENAIRHGGSGGVVHVEVAYHRGDVTISVADRGPGIAPGQESQIFERFHRSSRAGGGAGLGLTIARLAAVAHGGELELAHRDPAQTGATFILRLPSG
jgi:two-component system, OmpR family, sensor kinase